MLRSELAQLAPYFREGERYLNGVPINWDEVSFTTMQALFQVREMIDSRVNLIRGPHPDPDGTKPHKRTAVDACAPEVDLGQVAMALFRLQTVSFGLYSGNSFHIDSRPYLTQPARWLAIKPEEEPQLEEAGLKELITSRVDGWLYLSWGHPRSYEGLFLVLSLAKQKAGLGTVEV